MNRFVALSVAVLVVSLLVGGALKAQAATSSVAAPRAVPAVQSVDNGSTDSGYWAAWADAASH